MLNKRMQKLVDNAIRIEGEIYGTANSQFEYYQSLAGKIYEIQRETGKTIFFFITSANEKLWSLNLIKMSKSDAFLQTWSEKYPRINRNNFGRILFFLFFTTFYWRGISNNTTCWLDDWKCWYADTISQLILFWKNLYFLFILLCNLIFSHIIFDFILPQSCWDLQVLV